jgi:hypothetical protein
MPDGSKVFTPEGTKHGQKRQKEQQPMSSRFRPQLTYSNAIATIALFVALGGAAVAAGLPKGSVGPRQLKRGAVTTAALRRAAVRSGKLAPKSVIAGKLGPGAVLAGKLANGAVTTAKIANSAVIASSIKNSVVTTNKLNNNAVTTQKLADGSVTPGKLSDEFGPIVATLKSGQTLRGVFDVGSTGVAEDLIRSAVSFQFPLLGAPTVTVLQPGETTANCSGLGGGNAQTPQATGGNLCVYVTTKENLDETAPFTPLAVENNTRLGFGLAAKANASGPYFAYGQWAVTAP